MTTPLDSIPDDEFQRLVKAVHAPIAAELRAFGIPTGDSDPLAGVRLLIERTRDLEQRLG